MRKMLTGAALGALVLAATPAAAQQLDQFVIKGPAADRIGEKNEMSLATAKRIAAACEAEATKRGAAASIAILDQFGQQIYFERMDGLRGHRQLDAAVMKAHAVIVSHTPSHFEQNRIINGQYSEFHMGFNHDMFIASGGLPIVVDKQFIGAIGVGGSGFDEQCGHDALEQVVGPQPPLTPTIPRKE